MLGSKGLKVNVRRTKMMINRENAAELSKEGKFPCAVFAERA